jgi:hypothetical protein
LSKIAAGFRSLAIFTAAKRGGRQKEGSQMTTLLILLVSFFAGHPVHTMNDNPSGQTCEVIHETGTESCQ